MKLDGFRISCGYLLATGAQEFDVHNEFTLVNVAYDPQTALASVVLHRSNGDWVRKNTPMALVLRFEHVSLFRQRDGAPQQADGRNTIDFIGFLYPEDETMDGFLDDLTDPTQDLIIGMVDGAAYRLHAKRITLEVSDG